MMPPYEFSLNSRRSALKKVAEWLSNQQEDESQSLYMGLPGDFGNLSAAYRVHNSLSNYTNCDSTKLEQKTRELYEIVLKTLGGNEFRLSALDFPENEKSKVVDALVAAGYNVCQHDFLDIILVAKAVRDAPKRVLRPPFKRVQQFRHASLNCYDYDRFKEELKDLAGLIGFGNLESNCGTLVRIATEAAAGESDSYPARHLIIGRTAWHYQCLHIMDEILCTEGVKDFKDMKDRIKKKAKEYGIEGQYIKDKGFIEVSDLSISDEKLKKLYANLSELINVEHAQGKKVKYDKSVYDSEKKRHRIYKTYKNNRRLSAFTVDISVQEAADLRKEIAMLRVKYFDDDREEFGYRFPLLSSLGNMEEYACDFDDETEVLNSLTNTDMVTINYKQSEYPELKKKVQNAVDLRIPIAVKTDEGWEMVLPVSIKEDRDKWALLAQIPDTLRSRIVPPDVLNETFSFGSDNPVSDNQSTPIPDCVIGIGKLIKEEPYEVTLELTKAGLEDVRLKDSAFRPLNPSIACTNGGFSMRMQKGTDYSKAGQATFMAYINEDFLCEVFNLDKTAKLISIQPQEVCDLYEQYYKTRMKKNRIPLEARAPSMKRLKEPRQKLKE